MSHLGNNKNSFKKELLDSLIYMAIEKEWGESQAIRIINNTGKKVRDKVRHTKNTQAGTQKKNIEILEGWPRYQKKMKR